MRSVYRRNYAHYNKVYVSASMDSKLGEKLYVIKILLVEGKTKKKKKKKNEIDLPHFSKVAENVPFNLLYLGFHSLERAG